MVKATYDATGEQVTMAKNFVISSKLEPFYMGGSILLSRDQTHLICQCDDYVKVVDIKTGQTVKSIQSEEDVVTAMSADNTQLFTAHRASLLIKQWQWREEGQLPTRSWKAHSVPVTALTMDPSSSLLVSGATDGAIRVWDIERSFCTHQLKGSKGVITLLTFHPDELYVVSTADDLLIRVWDLNTSTCIHTFQGHVSPVTSFTFLNESTLVTGGRDKVVNTWCLEEGKLKSTLPVYEVLEGTAVCDDKIVTAGAKGVLRSWDKAKCVFEQPTPPLARQFTYLMAYKEGVIGVTFDHNIIIFNKQLQSVKHFIGYNDEILDIKDAGGQHIAMATNSEQIRVVDTASLSTEIITGHTDTVLSIDTQVQHSLLVSGSKDHSVKVWSKKGSSYECVTTCTGHTGAVSGVSWCRNVENMFFVSVSVDLTLKLWQTSGADSLTNIKCVYTQKAHEKDINCCVVSPNDQLIVTGSLDKTAKVWKASNGGLQGTLRGHKRGIWCVRFSPVDQCVLTASGDTMLKMWRLSDYSCVRTFEGHSASVLNCSFITNGKQIVSTGADGLVKVWDTQTAECVTTLDGHTDKVWALCVKEGVLLTGAADSLLCLWTDVTKEEEEKEIKEEKENTEQHQKLNNHLHKKQYAEAFKLSLALGMPFKCLGVAERMLLDPSGQAQLTGILEELAVDELETLLGYISTWNTNSKHTIVSQTVLHSLLSSKRGTTLSTLPTLRQHWEALIPYTERHLERLTRLQQQSTFLQYTWDRIKLNEM